MRVAVVALMLLAGCDEVAPAPSGNPVAEPKSAMDGEAEKVCAELTGYSPEAMVGKPVETQVLFRREFNLCVSAVNKGEAPALRGKSDALQ